MTSSTWPDSGLPQEEHVFKKWLRQHARQALQWAGVRAGAAVLDYGCGSGAFTWVAADLVGPDGQVLAADVSGASTAAVRAHAEQHGLSQVSTMLAPRDPADLLLPPDWADVVLLYDMLHVVDEKQELLRRVAATLKAGGVLSVFPMHVGTDQMLALAAAAGRLRLAGTAGLLMNFEPLRDDRG